MTINLRKISEYVIIILIVSAVWYALAVQKLGCKNNSETKSSGRDTVSEKVIQKLNDEIKAKDSVITNIRNEKIIIQTLRIIEKQKLNEKITDIENSPGDTLYSNISEYLRDYPGSE